VALQVCRQWEKKEIVFGHELIVFLEKEKVQEIMTIQSPTSYIHLFAINMHYTP
jgi:hypothetical protein